MQNPLRQYPLRQYPLRITRGAGHVARLVLAASSIVVAGMALAQEAGSVATQIYQQRTADGRIVLTDRPVAGAVTQRTWQRAPEDAALARQRREEAQLQALAVTVRIQRQVELQLQRDHELAIERLRLAQAEAQLDAERARADAAAQQLVLLVPRFARPARIPMPGWRRAPPRGFGMFGATSG